MEKIARCIYLISLLTGWFALKYDRQKNRVRYSKLIYCIGRFEFYFFAVLGGFGVHYDNDFFVDLGLDVINILLIHFQKLFLLVTVIKFYARLKNLRFEIVKFGNKSIKMFKILNELIQLKVDRKFIRIIIFKIMFVDLTAIAIKVSYEIFIKGFVPIYTIFSTILAILFVNFLNLNNLHLIVMMSLSSCIHNRLKAIFGTIVIPKNSRGER